MAGERQELEELRRLAELEAKAKPSSAVPGDKPLPGLGERLMSFGKAGVQGLMGGGIGNVPGSIGAEAMKQTGDAIERGGYNVGGAVTDVAGPEAGVAANAAVQAIPMMIGGGTGRAAERGSEALARQLMKDAINPSAAARLSGEGDRAVGTFLEKGASPTQGGIAKLKAMFPELMGNRSRAIEAATDTIPKGEISAAVQPVIAGIEKRNPFPSGPRAEAEGVIDAWGKNIHIPENMTAREAQNFKEGLGDILKNKFGKPTTEGEVLAQKAMEAQLRQSIERVAPGAAGPNKEMSALINAIKQASPRASRGGGPTALGIAPAAGSPEMQIAMMADRNPWLKSMLARMLYQGGKSNVPTAAGVGAGGIYSASDPGVP